jgi:hypothetical protein
MEDTFNIYLVFCVCHIKVKLFVIVINTTSLGGGSDDRYNLPEQLEPEEDW